MKRKKDYKNGEKRNVKVRNWVKGLRLGLGLGLELGRWKGVPSKVIGICSTSWPCRSCIFPGPGDTGDGRYFGANLFWVAIHDIDSAISEDITNQSECSFLSSVSFRSPVLKYNLSLLMLKDELCPM